MLVHTHTDFLGQRKRDTVVDHQCTIFECQYVITCALIIYIFACIHIIHIIIFGPWAPYAPSDMDGPARCIDRTLSRSLTHRPTRLHVVLIYCI